MIILSPDEAEKIRHFVLSLQSDLKNDLIRKLENEFFNKLPTELETILNDTESLAKLLSNLYDEKPNNNVQVDDYYIPIICSSILNKRKDMARRLDDPLSKTFHEGIIAKLEIELTTIEQFMDKEWFKQFKPIIIPPLSEYLVTKYIDKFQNSKLSQREYDQKFSMLLSPSLFYKDLEHFRQICDFRNCGLSVAYIDIDDFKQYNTNYTESTVDRVLLPRFMKLIESHFFYHGFVYRYGGDEYVVIVPNLSIEMSKALFREFQTLLYQLQFPGIEGLLTVSIGIYFVTRYCVYTEKEIEAKANLAKKKAKDSGKNTIYVLDEDH